MFGQRHRQAAGRKADALAQDHADADRVDPVKTFHNAVAELRHEGVVHGPVRGLRVMQERRSDAIGHAALQAFQPGAFRCNRTVRGGADEGRDSFQLDDLTQLEAVADQAGVDADDL